MVRLLNEGDSVRWRYLKGYDIKTVQGDIREAPFVPKSRAYQRYWAMWGLQFFKRPWKRPKILTRECYLIVMMSILPGIWMDLFLISVTDNGVAHLLQVFTCVTFISITLIYAECFLGDYTKRSACYIWNAIPISYCLFPLQVLSVIVESQFGCIRTLIYLQRFIHGFLFMEDWHSCDQEQYGELKCFDEDVDTLSHRCESDDVWVACPDRTRYILPTHYHYLNECNWRILFAPERIGYILIYWFMILYIATKGLTEFVKTIKWAFIIVILLYSGILIYLLAICGKEAVYSVGIMTSFDINPLISFKAWIFSFWVSLKLCSWSMMTYWTIASGLTFRTGRWLDSLFMMTIAMTGILYRCVICFGFTGCLAKRISTRIQSIWKLKGIMYTDAIVPYYLRDLPAGPLLTAIHNFNPILLSIWKYAGMVDGLIYGIAELSDMLYWQPTLLVVFVLLSIPVSIMIISFAHCTVVHDTPVRTAYASLQLIYMAGYAITVFWLYGASTLSEDHFFMYGYKPHGFIATTWPWIPFIFIVINVGDIYYNSRESPEKLHASMLTHFTCFLIVILGIVFMVAWYRFQKIPYSHLLKPVFTWGPPNGPLRRARKQFLTRPAISFRETVRRSRMNKELHKKIHQHLSFRGPGLETDLITSRWKKLIRSGIIQRREKSGELVTEAARALVYAEDVSFFELTLHLTDTTESQVMPGTLPGTSWDIGHNILIDEMELQMQDSNEEFLKVDQVQVKETDETAEGVGDEY